MFANHARCCFGDAQSGEFPTRAVKEGTISEIWSVRTTEECLQVKPLHAAIRTFFSADNESRGEYNRLTVDNHFNFA